MLDRLGSLFDAASPVLGPLHWVLLFLPVLAMAGAGLAWLAGYRFEADIILYAFLIKYGVLVGVALLTLVTVIPMGFAVWWLRTSREDRPRPMLLWLLEHGGFMGLLVIGVPGLDLLAENLLVEQGWLGKGTAILAGYGIAFAVVMPIGMLYGRWLFRSIERNAPWIDRFAPWAPRAVAAGLALLVAAPTAWAAYAYTRPLPPPPVREVVIPPTWLYLEDRGAITTCAGTGNWGVPASKSCMNDPGGPVLSAPPVPPASVTTCTSWRC
jgi:hypothetical protein